MPPELLDSNKSVSAADFLHNLQKENPFLAPPQPWFAPKMPQVDSQYTKLRWLLTLVGLFLYVVDIGTDVMLALEYFQKGKYVWSGLTVLFVLAGLFVTQTFSYVWYRNDMKDDAQKPEEKTTISGMSTRELAALHLCGMGIFTRHFHLLKDAFSVVWTKSKINTQEEIRKVNKRLFDQATNLSMLKMFEAFLESVPQLLLQLFIVLSGVECNFMQFLSMAFSFFNIAWSLVDYRRCQGRSVSHISQMPSGIPTIIYLLYKLCTITSHIFSYALLLTLSIYSTVAFTIMWLFWTTWAGLLQTNFCSSRGLEYLYRAVVGFILTFTFFNVKGQDTRVPMTLYYIFYSLVNMSAPLLLVFLSPELQTVTSLLTVSSIIYGGLLLGLVCLVLFYLLLHPREKCQEADEVDGLGGETQTTRRIRNFLQP